MDPISEDQSLVLQAQAGNPDAFARLYDACVERVYRYIYFRVTDDETAEDITSQVFIKAWENLDRYKIRKSPFISWLYRIARNAVIDHYRTRKETLALEEVSPVQVSADESLDEVLEMQFVSHELRLAMQQLTEEQRQVLILKFVDGLSTPEITKLMGKRQGAVRALQMRALQRLAKYLGNGLETNHDSL